ncbi:hypothetical protein Dda_2111 [Drechslerella dactyloides]|uniref:Uncharacterized protein n=1 Tax=Drechslerella dactyloides TaxID=74499 RepID=A0AAD6J735_DREDA|nr:hypothetical protein Dda_2111 [Drechslerella dactyloides]
MLSQPSRDFPGAACASGPGQPRSSVSILSGLPYPTRFETRKQSNKCNFPNVILTRMHSSTSSTAAARQHSSLADPVRTKERLGETGLTARRTAGSKHTDALGVTDRPPTVSLACTCRY